MSVNIAISAGEFSGDEHAAALVKAIAAKSPDASFFGMGGRSLRAAGVDTIVDSEKSASVMGFQEVLMALPRIISALKKFKQELKSRKPDLLILVDYPDFNFQLAKHARKIGIPVLYFITPKLWAWRKGRVKLFPEYIDKAACIFPFEPDYFATHGYDKAHYVGHPFADNPEYQIPNTEEKAKLLKDLGLSDTAPILTVFPGSRNREIACHMPIIAEALLETLEKHPALQTIVSIAPNMTRDKVAPYIPDTLPVHYYDGNSLDLLKVADAGLIKSGTSNLQAAFFELPFAMFYKGSKTSEFIVKNFVSLTEFSIINLIRTGTVDELVGELFNPEDISKSLERMLFSDKARAQVEQGLREVHSALVNPPDEEIFVGCKTPYERTAALALELMS